MELWHLLHPQGQFFIASPGAGEDVVAANSCFIGNEGGEDVIDTLENKDNRVEVAMI